ncbi:MAG: ribokinase [Oscillospiraceae bacterium]|nr:ribokinase [Oscillospiraceae bacterium]
MKILNFGSLNLDYVYSVDHFVREGETIASFAMNEFLGGKGFNQSIALARAGCSVYHAGKIGVDGGTLLERLKAERVNVNYLMTEDKTPTGHAIIQVDRNGQNCILLFGGANRTITCEEIDSVLANFDAGDLILLQNEVTNVEYIIERAHARGMRIALNPSPIDEDVVRMKALHHVDWFILNEIEGFALTGKKLGEEICDVLGTKFPNARIVLTLGKLGVMYYDKKSFIKHGVYEVPVIDTTAAGDTFTGYFLCCVSDNRAVEESLEIASRAASLAVTKAGASDSIPVRKDVDGAKIRLMAQFL